jgi:putative transcriptional regulator
LDYILKNNLRVARAEKRLTQADLAEMAGITRQTVSAIENQEYNPSARLALILCMILDKDFSELFYLAEAES